MIKKSKEFAPHKCTSKGTESAKPQVAYMAEWYNVESKRTRWVGPERMRKSVEKAPYDERYRRRQAKGGVDVPWKLVRIYICDLNWKPADN